MQRISISAQLRGTAAPPAGEPPETHPRATSVSVQPGGADGSDAGIDRISYENHVVFTSEWTFTETGTVVFGEGDEHAVDVETVGQGTLAPAAEDGLLHGAVVWRITDGRGRFAGATGLIASNFLLRPDTGDVDELQATVMFVR